MNDAVSDTVRFIVYPRLLDSRDESGQLILHVHDGLTLTLEKSSVLANDFQYVVSSSTQSYTEIRRGGGASSANEGTTNRNDVRKYRDNQGGSPSTNKNHSPDFKHLNSVAKAENSTLEETEETLRGTQDAHDAVGSCAMEAPQDGHESGDDACATAHSEDVNAMQSIAKGVVLFVIEHDNLRGGKNDTGECRTNEQDSASSA
ncbi:hypothetical protein MRX96_025753 [Rhipicephalus microplus]